jgi:hypothetical protein
VSEIKTCEKIAGSDKQKRSNASEYSAIMIYKPRWLIGNGRNSKNENQRQRLIGTAANHQSQIKVFFVVIRQQFKVIT